MNDYSTLESYFFPTKLVMLVGMLNRISDQFVVLYDFAWSTVIPDRRGEYGISNMYKVTI